MGKHSGLDAQEVWVSRSDGSERWATFEETRVTVQEAVAAGVVWRPVAHGVRLIWAQGDQGEEEWTDFVDIAEYNAAMEALRAKGVLRGGEP